MKKNKLTLIAAAAALSLATACTGNDAKEAAAPQVNDSNTPLHLLEPAYKTPYAITGEEQIKPVLERVLTYLDKETPHQVVDKNTKEPITDYSKIDENSQLARGAFRLASYEWGVTYLGMLLAAQNTGDQKYFDYVSERFNFLSEVAPKFRELMQSKHVEDGQMRQILDPHALDDAGAMCASMIRAQIDGLPLNTNDLIDNYMNFIMNKEYRLSDGTFARVRPQKNAMWLDDMFMSVPAIVYMGKHTGDTKYYDEALKQIKGFTQRMFVPEKNLYMHAWIEGEREHPAFHWGRANGWAILTNTIVLDILPEGYPGRDYVMDVYRKHVKGLTALQSGEGFWHQLLERNDSYMETSATAIYTYCIAKGINEGWLDAVSYGPVAQLGWNATATQVNAEGQVENVCVGTGMGFDPAFYYYRPVNVFAAHGYGPVLLAGAEMIRLNKNQHPKMNDSAVQYYSQEIKTDKPIFSVE